MEVPLYTECLELASRNRAKTPEPEARWRLLAGIADRLRLVAGGAAGCRVPETANG